MIATSRARGPAPLVGVMGCAKFIAPHPYHAAGEKYIAAVAEAAGAIPLVIPPLGAACDAPDVVARLDGLLVTGSPSNVVPALYGGPPSAPGTLHDAARDATALPLIRAALDAGCPLFAICRGMQELNVVRGGTLHQKIHQVAGRDDHRADTSQTVETQYGPAHPVRLEPGGVIAGLAGAGEIIVNSIHSQGIDRLGDGLAVEAVATDGQIEAVRVSGAPAFALGVQWHPEWRFEDDPVSTALFEAFGAACRARAQAAVPS